MEKVCNSLMFEIVELFIEKSNLEDLWFNSNHNCIGHDFPEGKEKQSLNCTQISLPEFSGEARRERSAIIKKLLDKYQTKCT